MQVTTTATLCVFRDARGNVQTRVLADFYDNICLDGYDAQGVRQSYDDEARHIGEWLEKHPSLNYKSQEIAVVADVKLPRRFADGALVQHHGLDVTVINYQEEAEQYVVEVPAYEVFDFTVKLKNGQPRPVLRVEPASQYKAPEAELNYPEKY
jgi:hypothetical protein